MDPQTRELASPVHVFGGCGGRLRLVYGHFHFPVVVAVHLGEVLVQRGNVRYGPTIFDGGAAQGDFVEGDAVAIAVDRRCQVALCHILRGISQLRPWERDKTRLQSVRGSLINRVVDIRARIECIEGVASGNTAIDVVGCLR